MGIKVVHDEQIALKTLEKTYKILEEICLEARKMNQFHTYPKMFEEALLG
jgi:hypothetical protein